MTPRQAIRQLEALAAEWPKGISLMSASGTLLVIENETARVIAAINGIRNDGGDPDIETRSDGEDYIVRVTNGAD